MLEPISIVFILTSIVLIITPGQDMVLVMSRSISQGSKAGVATAAGVSVGLLGHTALATLGLGALLNASQILFFIMKLLGAGYLFYLGIKMIRSKNESLNLNHLQETSFHKMFFQGIVSNISNPKIAIFYFSYIPQFVPSNSIAPTKLIFTLGCLFAIITFFIKVPIGYGTGLMSMWLRSRPLVIEWINRVSGLVLIGLGIRLALEKRN